MNRRLLILLMVAMLALAGLAQAGTRYNVPVTELSVTLTDENQVPLEFVLLKLMFPEAPNAVATASTNKNGVAVFNTSRFGRPRLLTLIIFIFAALLNQATL